jgi:hypothetical protein
MSGAVFKRHPRRLALLGARAAVEHQESARSRSPRAPWVMGLAACLADGRTPIRQAVDLDRGYLRV